MTRPLVAVMASLSLLVVATAGTAAPPSDGAGTSATLRSLADARGLLIGSAVGVSQLGGDTAYRDILNAEFNAVTPENAMKWDATEPSRGQFTFSGADAIVTSAQENNQVVHGHTLIWHSQTPAWVQGLSAADLRTAMQAHISTVVGRYADRVAAWDVVNEPFNEDGTLRGSFWLQRLGAGYIADAFRLARQADPDARLYLNDYNVEGVNAKSTAMFNLVSSLRQQGVPIDGVGLQAHLILGQVPGTLRQNIERFAALGLDVKLTELDIRMQLPADATKLAQQATDYRAVADACFAVPRCRGITVWGFTDRYSWVPDVFPGQGAATPFGENYQPKPAYQALAEALGGTIPPPPPPPPPGGCEIRYAASNWGGGGGFTANLTITNRSGAPIDGWTLAWTFTAGQAVIQPGWSATYTQSGFAVTARNLSWNQVIPPGGSVGIGFNGTWNGTNPPPVGFTVNGTACAIG